MKKTSLTLAVAAVLCTGAAITNASDQLAPYQGAQTSIMDKPFMDLDSDRDGVISKSEADNSEVLREQFTAVDTNRDGNVDPTEFSAFEERATPSAPAGPSSPGAGDSSSSSGATKDSLPAVAEELSGSGSERGDFHALDSDRDNALSKDEAAQSPRLSENFNAADSNKDGSLDDSEFAAFEWSNPVPDTEEGVQDRPSE